MQPSLRPLALLCVLAGLLHASTDALHPTTLLIMRHAADCLPSPRNYDATAANCSSLAIASTLRERAHALHRAAAQLNGSAMVRAISDELPSATRALFGADMLERPYRGPAVLFHKATASNFHLALLSADGDTPRRRVNLLHAPLSLDLFDEHVSGILVPFAPAAQFALPDSLVLIDVLPSAATKPNLRLEHRRRRQLSAVQRSTGPTSVLVVRVKSALDTIPEVAPDAASVAMNTVGAFYASSSGGAQTLQVDLVPSVFVTKSFCCTSKCAPTPDIYLLYDEIAAALPVHDRYVVLLPGCNKFTFGGVSEVTGNRAWIAAPADPDSYAAVIAHELGHTNGANHAAMGALDYGNPYTLMGSARRLPQGDFEAAAKTTFGWLQQPSQVPLWGASDLPHCTGACAGLARLTNRQIWLAPHDTGALDPSQVYGLKLATSQPGHFLWIEARSSFSQLAGRALFSWASDNFPLPGEQRMPQYGPSQLLPYIQLPPGQVATGYEAVPVGGVFSKDDVVLQVLDYDAQTGNVQVQVTYMPLNVDYTSKAMSGSMTCGSGLDVAGSVDSPLFATDFVRLSLTGPARVSLANSASTSSCNQGDDGMLYLYPRYPVHLEQAAANHLHVDPRVGAVYSAPLCTAWGAKTADLANALSATGIVFQDMAMDAYVWVQRNSHVGPVHLAASCQAMSSCPSGYFAAGNWCQPCPAGNPSSLPGSMGAASCFTDCGTMRLTAGDGRFAGVYARLVSAPFVYLDAVAYQSLDAPTPVYVTKGGASVQSAWQLRSQAGPDTILVQRMGTSAHPVQLSSKLFAFTCACDGTGFYQDPGSGACTQCPPARPFSQQGAMGLASCYSRCAQGSGLKSSSAGSPGLAGSFDLLGPQTYFSRALGLTLSMQSASGTWLLSDSLNKPVAASERDVSSLATAPAKIGLVWRTVSGNALLDLQFVCVQFRDGSAGAGGSTSAPHAAGKPTKAPTTPLTVAPSAANGCPTQAARQTCASLRSLKFKCARAPECAWCGNHLGCVAARARVNSCSAGALNGC